MGNVMQSSVTHNILTYLMVDVGEASYSAFVSDPDCNLQHYQAGECYL